MPSHRMGLASLSLAAPSRFFLSVARGTEQLPFLQHENFNSSISQEYRSQRLCAVLINLKIVFYAVYYS